MDDDVVFFAMVQRYNIYFKYVSLHHDILGSHGAKSSTENIYWAKFISLYIEFVSICRKMSPVASASATGETPASIVDS